MINTLLKRIEKNRKRHSRWLALVLCLSMIVSMGTFASLHLTGETKTYTKQILECPYAEEGAEPVAHTHNDDCYDEDGNLVCLLPEIEAHTHTDECYTENRILECDLEETPGHVHSDECYTEKTEQDCDIEENPGHTHTEECWTLEQGDLICGNFEEDHEHTDECFAWEEVLSCQQEEGEGAHTHTDDCYKTELVLACNTEEGEGAHTHTDECWRTERELSCGMEELPVHIHNSDCIKTVDLTAEEIEERQETLDEEWYEEERTDDQEPAEGQIPAEGQELNENEEFFEDQEPGEEQEPTEDREPGVEREPTEDQVPGEEQEPADDQEPGEEQKTTEDKESGEMQEPADDQEPGEEQKTTEDQEPGEEQEPTDEQESDDDQEPTEEQEPNEEQEPTEDQEQFEEQEPTEEQDSTSSQEPTEESEPIPESDFTADLEAPEDWEKSFEDVELTGDWQKDFLLIAESQLGYQASQRNFDVVWDESKTYYSLKGWTRYGAWYGIPYGDWCAMFISFCLNYADIPETAFPYDCATTTWVKSLEERDMYADAGDYTPKAGDLIFFDWEGDHRTDHVGIVYEVDEENGTLKTVEGNRTITVEIFNYMLNDGHIMGYGILPENPDYVPETQDGIEIEEADLTEKDEEEKKKDEDGKTEEEATDAAEAETVFPTPAQSFEKRVGGLLVKVEADEGAFPEGTVMSVSPVNGEMLRSSVSDVVDGEVLEVQAVDISFYTADGTEIEPSVPIRVMITPARSQHEDKNTQVVHIDDSGVASTVEQTADETAGNRDVVFDTDSFSIYAVVFTTEVYYRSYTGETFKIALDYDENTGIPSGAELHVSEILPEDEEYGDYYARAMQAVTGDEKAPENSYARFFDIEIRSKGEKVEPTGNVAVSISLEDAPEETEATPKVVHFAEEGTQLLEAEAEKNESGTDVISFTTDGFSVFSVVYTVDFEYSVNGKMYQFSLPGGEKIALSDLIEVLGIIGDTNNGEKAAFNSVDSFLKEVANVEFSDESLVKVTPLEGDWELESLQPFSTDEDLTITMKNGDVVTVKVTDAQYTDITSLLSSVTISGATQNSDGSYNVFPGTPYTIALKFDETPGNTFNRNGSLTYKLPNGVKIPEATSGTLVPSDSTQAEIYSINYTIAADGTITFTWDIKPGKEQDFLALPGLFIGLNIEAEFDENATTIDWHGAAQVTVDKTHDVGVNKTANLGQDGYMYYTVTVTSTGDNKNISLTDTISGTALTLDQSSITETTNHGATFSNKTNKGFDISIPELKHGESATITYRAKVDYDVLASEAGVEKGHYGTVTTTGNQIRINGTDDNPDNNTSETHADHNISFSSAGKGVTEGHYNEETGKRTMNWQIKANEEHRTTISYIHDKMGEGSDKMSYSGEGIKVKVVNPDWSVAATYTVPWSQLGVNSNSTEWTYNIPDQYKDKNYSFVIDYTTDVDVSDSIVPVTVKNDADTDYGEGGTGGKADPAPGSKLDMEKSVVETDIPGGTVTWSITVDVPANGLDSCVVTDTLPTVSGPESFTDGFDSSSFSAARDVSGLIDGETVSLDTTQSGKVIFTFYKDGQPGLYPVEGGRQVTITLTTTLDEDWMAYEITQDYLRYYNTHTNNAKVVANNYTVEDSASVNVNTAEPAIIKKNVSTSNAFKTGSYSVGNVTVLPAWMYRIYVYGISDDAFDAEGNLTITDTFDNDYLAYYEPDGEIVTIVEDGNVQSFHQKLTYNTSVGGSDNVGNASIAKDVLASVSGNTVTFTINKGDIQTNEGAYYPEYVINYYMHVKDVDTITKMSEDAISAGGTLKLKNTAYWEKAEPSEVEVDYKIPIISKDYSATDEEKAKGEYHFEIKVNEGGNQLGDADYLEVTDSYTNLTIDYATLTCEPEDALLSYTHSGNTVTYFVKNGVPVTLRYTASALESGAFSNTVEVNNQSVTKTGTANITSRGSTGAREASIKILKHSGSNLLEGISGVQFELYEYDESFPNNYNPAAKVLAGTYSTDANGMFTIQHIPLAVEDGSYTTHTKKYVLHEVEPPEGYKALPHDYVFTVDTQTALYGQYIYLHDDTLPISNEPVKEDDISITVKKIWPDGDADLPELIRVRLYQKDSRTAPAASAIEVEVAEMTRGTDGSWTHTFTGLDPERAYFIKEDPVEGYTASYSSNNILGLEQSGTINITNTKDEPDDETASITVKKKWMQGEEEITDIEQKKDLSATVELVRYRTSKSTTAVHFYHVGDSGWTKLADETIPQGQGVEFSYTAGASYAEGMGVFSSIDTTKAAHDSQGTPLISGKPGQANGSSQTITVNSEGYDDLYVVWKYNSAPTISGFEVINEGTGSSGGDVTATIDPTYTNPETITLDRENGWRASFSNLPTSGTGSDDGKAYSYTYGIRETATSDSSFAFESYSVDTYEGEGSNNATAAVASGSTVTVTNKKEAPQTGSLKLTKVVQVDGDTPSTDAEKKLVNGDYVFTVSSGNSIVKYVQITVTNGIPASYKIADTKDALESATAVQEPAAILSDLAEGDYVITEIEKNGMTLKEAARGDGNTGAVSSEKAVTVHVTAGQNEPADTSAAAATFTNNIETVTAKVVKVWDHSGNTGTMPTSLTVTLSNGETKELNEGNNWRAEVTDLPKYDRTTGNLIEYSWTEAELPAGYYLSNIQETTDTATGVITTTLTNSYTDHYNPTTTITGKKVWDDGGEGRPDSITVNLYKDGGSTPYRTITVQAPTGEGADQDQWPFEFTNLPVFNSDGSVIQYTVGEVLPEGYTNDYNINIAFEQATYIAGDATGQIVNSGQGSQVFELCDGTDLGWIVIRHGNDFIVWTPRAATDTEKEAIRTEVVKLSDQFNGINTATGNSMKYIHGVPMTIDVGNKHAVSVYMNGTKVMMKFLNPNAWSDFAYGTIPYTYTQTGGEGGGTITNKMDTITVIKEWSDHGTNHDPVEIAVYGAINEHPLRRVTIIFLSTDGRTTYGSLAAMIEKGETATIKWNKKDTSSFPSYVLTDIDGESIQGCTLVPDYNTNKIHINGGDEDLSIVVRGDYEIKTDTLVLKADDTQAIRFPSNKKEYYPLNISNKWIISGSLKETSVSDKRLPATDNSGYKYIYYVIEKPINGYKTQFSPDTGSVNAPGTVTVYNEEIPVTIDIQIHKVDNNNVSIKLPGAEFTLIEVDSISSIHQVTGNGYNQTGITSSEEEHKGTLSFTDLTPGYYYLKETQPPPGYVILNDGWHFMVDENGIVQNSGDFSQNGEFQYTSSTSITVTNTPGTELPMTGGIGTKLFTALGGVMSATAGAVLTLRLRKKKA